jgi:hypothetical protein
MRQRCETCHETLVEYEHKGMHVKGCVTCNQWEIDGESFQLDHEDWLAVKNDNTAEHVTISALEKAGAEDLQSYLDRGRPLQNLTDEALDAKFVEVTRAWAKSPLDVAMFRPVNDVLC